MKEHRRNGRKKEICEREGKVKECGRSMEREEI